MALNFDLFIFVNNYEDVFVHPTHFTVFSLFVYRIITLETSIQKQTVMGGCDNFNAEPTCDCGHDRRGLRFGMWDTTTMGQ